MSYSWPEFDTNYDAAVHAIGRMTVLWNVIEDEYNSLLVYCAGGGWGNHLFLTTELNNSQKIGLIRFHLKDTPERFGILAAPIERFLKNAQICGGNRNFYIHAYLAHDETTFVLSKKAQGKIGATNIILPSISDLRKIADDMYNNAQFAKSIARLLRKNLFSPECLLNVELPEEPAQPESWDLHPTRGIHQAAKHPPQS